MRRPEFAEALRRRRSVLCLGAAALAAVCTAAGVEEICLEAACANAPTTAAAVERALAAAAANGGPRATEACSGVVAIALAPTPGTHRPVVVRQYTSLAHIAAVVAASMRQQPPPRPWRLFTSAPTHTDATRFDRWCSGRTAQHAAVAALVGTRTRIDARLIR